VAAISRVSSTTMAVVSEPYTRFWERELKYHVSPWRMISQSRLAVRPPIRACLGPGQQQALVGVEGLDDLENEGAGALQHAEELGAQGRHGS
jgi:hypothetical protein